MVQNVEPQRHIHPAASKTGILGDEIAQLQPCVYHPFPPAFLPHMRDHLRLYVKGMHLAAGDSGRGEGEGSITAAEFGNLTYVGIRAEQKKGLLGREKGVPHLFIRHPTVANLQSRLRFHPIRSGFTRV